VDEDMKEDLNRLNFFREEIAARIVEEMKPKEEGPPKVPQRKKSNQKIASRNASTQSVVKTKFSTEEYVPE
jgi:hypothetical protein